MKSYIIGIDEVGRGPLAGPVTAAAVMAPAITNYQLPISERKLLKGIKDSKKLSPVQREEWDKKIKTQNAKIKIAVASVGALIIDRIGISRAARLAVGRCLQKLKIVASGKILLDGSLYAPRTYTNQETIIKGDEKVPLIAAASIVAKVHRDKKMMRLHSKFPQYGFDIHKGYGTEFHRVAIRKRGLCPIHRRSFCKNFI